MLRSPDKFDVKYYLFDDSFLVVFEDIKIKSTIDSRLLAPLYRHTEYADAQ